MKTIVATLEWSKDGYGVWFDELSDVFSFGGTVDEAKTNAREAIEYSFDGVPDAPDWVKDGFDIAIRYDTAGLLNNYQHIFTKRALSKITGINESLLSQYAMGIKKPRPTQSKKIEDGLHRLAKELQTICLL
jgi:predicted RNase H-like HicB family nuclease